MKKEQLKPILGDFLKKMMGEWFPDKPLVKGLGISLIDANIKSDWDKIKIKKHKTEGKIMKKLLFI